MYWDLSRLWTGREEASVGSIRVAILHASVASRSKQSPKLRRFKALWELTKAPKSRAHNRFELTCEPLRSVAASGGNQLSVA